MSKVLISSVLAFVIGCAVTMIGFFASGTISTIAMAPGAIIAHWLYSGHVHEIGYAITAVVLNCFAYSVLAFLLLRGYRAVRSTGRKGIASF